MRNDFDNAPRHFDAFFFSIGFVSLFSLSSSEVALVCVAPNDWQTAKPPIVANAAPGRIS